MRTDVKIGIAVGVLVLLVAVIVGVAKNSVANKAKEAPIAQNGGDNGASEIKVVLPPGETPATPPAVAPPAPVNNAPSGITITQPPVAPPPVSPSPAPTIPPITPGGVVPPTSDTTYTTIRGDTFSSIAQKKYNEKPSDGLRYSKMLIKANPGFGETSIPAGTVLKLPGVRVDASLAGGAHPVSDTYTVAAGDNLWKIAQKQYNDAKYVDLLLSANPGVKSESLRVGQILTIPPKPSEADTAKPAIVLPTGAKDYTVASGDNLTTISEKFYNSGKYWKQIAAANPDTKDGTVSLKLGQKLVIPMLKDATPTSAPASLAHSATTRPAVTPTARRTAPAGSDAVSSTASAGALRPDFSDRLR